MSRRRDPRQELGESPEHWRVRIVCTGRRSHIEVDFGSVTVNLQSGSVLEHLAVKEFFVGLDFDAGKALKTIPFVCRRCTPARNVPLKRETLDQIVRGLSETRTSELDLSALGAVGPISS